LSQKNRPLGFLGFLEKKNEAALPPPKEGKDENCYHFLRKK